MKKTICGLLILLTLMLTGCNVDMIDTVFSYDYAYIDIPGSESIEGPVDSWRDYEDGDQIQVTIKGITYLTDTTRCVLVHH